MSLPLTVKSMLAAAALMSMASAASAQDRLKLAIGQRGNWDTAVAELGQQEGIFKKHGLTLELLYTQGTGETIQAVASGSVDIGVAAGTTGVMSAFSKGAPIRAIAAAFTGSSDLYYYVPADSKIKSMADAVGKTVGFSTNGSSSHTVALAVLKHYKVDAKPTATGGPASTYTQVMSNQIDVGWSSPPFGLDAVEQKKIRIVARGSEAPSLQDQTVRLLIANVRTLEQQKPVVERFMQAYREALDWMYTDDAALTSYAKWVGTTEALAKQARDEFYPRNSMNPDRISGLDGLMADAVSFKYIPAPLTQVQQGELFQIIPKK
jgi:NitT/TauT family transport system substrate-binding protein